MGILNAGSILQIAIKLEENGEKFYRHAEGVADVPEAVKIFKYLGDEEIKHKSIFEKMLSDLDGGKSTNCSKDFSEYLNTYVESLVFTKKNWDEYMYAIKDTVAAVEFGLQREIESINYFQEIKNEIPENQRPVIDEIIKEERKHFMRLSALKKLHGQKLVGALR